MSLNCLECTKEKSDRLGQCLDEMEKPFYFLNLFTVKRVGIELAAISDLQCVHSKLKEKS